MARVLSKDTRGAESDLTRAIEISPSVAQSYHWRGAARQGLGDHAGAISDFDARLAREPDRTDSLTARGESKAAIGDRAGAERDFQRALALDPGYGPALSRLKSLGAPAQRAARPGAAIPGGGNLVDSAAKLRRWDAAAVKGQGWTGPFPFVQQGLGTCWAATALMLVRAYGGQATILDLLRGMRGSVSEENTGDGRYGLDLAHYGTLVSMMNRLAPSGKFVRVPAQSGRMLERFRSDPTTWAGIGEQWRPALDGGVPQLMASAGHAWLILGRAPNAASPSFIVHDPKGDPSADDRDMKVGADGGPYWTRPEEWFARRMRERSPGFKYVAEVIYPTGGLPGPLPLQSIALPTLNEGLTTNGFVRFAHTDGDALYLRWNSAARDFYSWQKITTAPKRTLGEDLNVIERPYDRLDLQARVWNANRTPVRVRISAEVLPNGRSVTGELPPIQNSDLELPASGFANWTARIPGLCRVRPETGTLPFQLKVTASVPGQIVVVLDRYVLDFDLGPGPAIAGIAPAQAAAGSLLTITGVNFGASRPTGARVRFSGRDFAIVSWADTAITVRATLAEPITAPVSGSVTVLAGEDCETRAVPFTVLPSKVPPATLPAEKPVPAPPPGTGGYWRQTGVREVERVGCENTSPSSGGHNDCEALEGGGFAISSGWGWPGGGRPSPLVYRAKIRADVPPVLAPGTRDIAASITDVECKWDPRQPGYTMTTEVRVAAIEDGRTQDVLRLVKAVNDESPDRHAPKPVSTTGKLAVPKGGPSGVKAFIVSVTAGGSPRVRVEHLYEWIDRQ
jgi:hypothetical protein